MIIRETDSPAGPLFIAICILLMISGCADFPGKQIPQKHKPLISSTIRVPQNQKVKSDGKEGSHDTLSYSGDNDIDYLPLIQNEQENPECGPSREDESAGDVKGQSVLDEALDFYQASQDFWQQGEIDNALHSLDQAYSLIIEADAYDIPKLNQQKDDLRFMISKRILEIYASRHTTAKGNHNAIPLVLNADVQKEIDLMTTGENRDFFIAAYIRSGRYRPFIIEELKKAGLPEELSWLPLIESGYKVRALSKARALGLWQFISSTGYKFGLKRTHHIDERLDPYKSTLAAIEYLKELHEIFGDWMTVLAAYNCGENRVLSIIRDQNVNYLDDFWDLYQRLPCETRRYVPQFLATLHIVNHLDKYYMDDTVPDRPIEYDTVIVSKQTYLKNIADSLNVTEDQLSDLNPELRYKLLPPEDYPLKIPSGMKETLMANLENIAQCSQSQPDISYHRVRAGETLSTIASKYNTTVNEIAKLNNISRKKNITTGMVLKLPQSSDESTDSSSKEEKNIIYTVRIGDSIFTLAKRFDTTAKKILELNKLGTSNLMVGQTLKIAAGPLSGYDIYRVKDGDTASTIAKRYNMDLDDFLRINKLSKNSKIHPGQQVNVE
jgi:membrane-bound lytic murein transglycosylase D